MFFYEDASKKSLYFSEASFLLFMYSIYTIGHSNRAIDDFLHLLTNSTIQVLVDVRRFAGSRKYPHFNPDNLKLSLAEKNIKYVAIDSLGGRRKVAENSQNTIWKNPSFQAYADYMETPDFVDGIHQLEHVAKNKSVAIMCSEAVWWRCHRSMIADYLKAEGWEVVHIIGESQPKEHPYTAPAKIINGKLTYKLT